MVLRWLNVPLTKSELLDGANAWAEKQGYGLVTEAAFLKWVKEKLIPNPTPRGQGYGKGKAEDWSCIAYYRVLKIIRYKANGINHYRDQRLALWFYGCDIDDLEIRKDLNSFYKANSISMHRQIGHALSQPSSNKKSVPKKVEKAITKILKLDDLMNFTFLYGFDFGFVNQVIHILKSFMYTMVNPNYQGLSEIINLVINDLPENNVKNILIDDLKISIPSLRGLATDIEQYENISQIDINNVSMQNLINIRDFVNIVENTSKELLKLIPKAFELENIRLPRAIRNMVKRFLKEDLNDLINFNIQDKIQLFIILLRRSVINGNNGEPYRQLAELRLDLILRWMNINNFKIVNDYCEDELLASLKSCHLPEETINIFLEGKIDE